MLVDGVAIAEGAGAEGCAKHTVRHALFFRTEDRFGDHPGRAGYSVLLSLTSFAMRNYYSAITHVSAHSRQLLKYYTLYMLLPSWSSLLGLVPHGGLSGDNIHPISKKDQLATSVDNVSTASPA